MTLSAEEKLFYAVDDRAMKLANDRDYKGLHELCQWMTDAGGMGDAYASLCARIGFGQPSQQSASATGCGCRGKASQPHRDDGAVEELVKALVRTHIAEQLARPARLAVPPPTFYPPHTW